jgi:sec-independent protein translocase protein TatB
MFEVGFGEMLVIFVIALVVLGPTRLPGLVSKVGRWVGKARSMAREFKDQLENEVNLEDLNRMTEQRTKEARAAPSTPPPPPELSGTPLASVLAPGAAALESQDTTTAGSGAAPQPADDTYSHAHAYGTAPTPYTPEAAEFSPAAPEVVAPLGDPDSPAAAALEPSDSATTPAVTHARGA